MKTYTSPRFTSLKQQSGMVSLVITMIMMLVVTITVLGFSQVARRDQRQALDKQLSSQAYYAAESGVNTAVSIINKNYLAIGQAPPDKPTCTTDPNYSMFNSGANVIDSTTNTAYTCVLIQAAPSTLKYDLSVNGASKVVPINTGGSTINSLHLSWVYDNAYRSGSVTTCQNASKSQPPVVTAPPLKAVTPWNCKYGIVRIDLVPMNALDRASMLANTFTAYLSPEYPTGTGTVAFSPGLNVNGGTANQGARPSANCDNSTCSISITGLSGSSYYARISTLYRDTTVTLSALDISGNALGLGGVQALVDSTGRSQDVLRRIQVRVPLVNNIDRLHNDYAIESTNGICKVFFAFPSAGYDFNNPVPQTWCD